MRNKGKYQDRGGAVLYRHVEDAIGHGLHNLTHHGEQATDHAQQPAHDVGQQAQQAMHDTTQRAQDAIDSAKD